MTQAWAVFLASVVTASGAIIVAFINKFRKENHKDHEVVSGILRMLYKSVQRQESKIDRLDQRLDEHIQAHDNK